MRTADVQPAGCPETNHLGGGIRSTAGTDRFIQRATCCARRDKTTYEQTLQTVRRESLGAPYVAHGDLTEDSFFRLQFIPPAIVAYISCCCEHCKV